MLLDTQSKDLLYNYFKWIKLSYQKADRYWQNGLKNDPTICCTQETLDSKAQTG
jgi:hypothetical protein